MRSATTSTESNAQSQYRWGRRRKEGSVNHGRLCRFGDMIAFASYVGSVGGLRKILGSVSSP